MSQTSRFRLHAELEELLNSNKVYFQPPEKFKMGFPCIKYDFTKLKSAYADNRAYKLATSYTLTYITDEPDDNTVEAIIKHFRYCSYDRCYKSDNLYHHTFLLYY